MTQRGASVARRPIGQSRRYRPKRDDWSRQMIDAVAGVIAALSGRGRLCQWLSGSR